MTRRRGETGYRETAFGIIPRSKLIPLEIEGVKRAWDFILKKHKKTKISITPILIKKLHEIGFAWIFPKEGGKFRKVEVTVSDHTPPKYYLVSQFMDSYCKHQGTELKGKTAGIIGLGAIGTRIAEICNGLGMEVVYWSRKSRDERFSFTELDSLMKRADFIFPTLAQNEDTTGLITDKMLKSMRKSAIFVSIVHKIYNHDLLLQLTTPTLA